MNTKLFLSAATAALLAMSGAAYAQQAVSATTDLNVRAGPGPGYPVVGTIPVDGEATLHGCIEGSQWCQVTAGNLEGWAYSDYLIADNSGVEVVLTQRPAEMDVPVVTYRDTDPPGGVVGSVAGGATGAIAGAIIGGPLGAAVGGIAGAAGGGMTGGLLDPDPQVRTYIEHNPMDPVYLDGEVVVGASLPDTVQVYDIPDYEYRYVYVNGQPVLVEPDTRRIVYIVR